MFSPISNLIFQVSNFYKFFFIFLIFIYSLPIVTSYNLFQLWINVLWFYIVKPSETFEAVKYAWPLLQLIEEWITVTEYNRTDEVVDQSRVTMIWSIAVAIFCVGGMIGGAITGIVAERFGRKGGLLLNNILVAVAVIFEGTVAEKT